MRKKAKPAVKKSVRKRVRVPAIEIGLEFTAGSFLQMRITNAAIKKMLDHPQFSTVMPPIIVAFFERLMPEKRGRRRRKSEAEASDVVFTQPGGVEGKPN